ncbi:hypothetical protein ACNHKD_09080 [Methylocystis sp. JAN1]|uniref:hypothetical protein n=1 Tax=Methylocystis sp. JAN1 TaxID=3397211 RepID=UPI003FA32F26
MPRLSVSISDSFDSRRRAPKPDAYGRRPRHVPGVRIVGERETAPSLSSLFFKATATLVVIAAIAVSLAVWRLFTFHH